MFKISSTCLLLAIITCSTSSLFAATSDEELATLITAAKRGNLATVNQYFDNGYDFLTTDDMGKSALMYAAEAGQTAIVEKIILLCPDAPFEFSYRRRHERRIFQSRQAYDGSTALTLAARHGHTSTIKALTDTYNWNPMQANSRGRTPLMEAACQGHRSTVQSLITSCPEGFRQKMLALQDNFGKTALMLAVEEKHQHTARELIMAGADPEQKDCKGQTALMRATRYGYYDIAKDLLDCYVLINNTDNTGRTALIHAVQAGNVELVQLLAHYGANVKIGDHDGRTPLTYAALSGDNTMIALLISLGAARPEPESESPGQDSAMATDSDAAYNPTSQAHLYFHDDADGDDEQTGEITIF